MTFKFCFSNGNKTKSWILIGKIYAWIFDSSIVICIFFRSLIMDQSTSAAPEGPALTASGHVYINRYPWCKYLSYIRTLFGIVTVCSKCSYIDFTLYLQFFILVVFTAGLNALLSISAIPMGVYLLTISIPMFLLEFGKIVRMCCGFVFYSYTNSYLITSF